MKLPGTTIDNFLETAIALCLAIGVAMPAMGSGSSPADPIPFDPEAGPIPVTISNGDEVWLRADFVHASTVSHVVF